MSSAQDSNSSALHAEFVQGQPSAIGAVMEAVARSVSFHGRLVPRDDRPDLCQEALLHLVRSAPAREFGTDDEFLAFTRCLAHRRCVDWSRKLRKKNRVRDVAMPGADPDTRILESERRQLGTRVMALLKEPCRELFALHAGMGLTYDQIGDMTGRTPGALRTQAYECLKAARTVLRKIQRRRTTRLTAVPRRAS